MGKIPKTYNTSDVSKIIGIHPNTVRMYEDLELISKPKRQENGYRIFTDLHIEQFKLARTALQIEVLQNGLRKKAINIIKLSALCKFDEALALTQDYLKVIENEIENANEAICIAQSVLIGNPNEQIVNLKRKDVSKLLNISMDTLRNWEMNGLLRVKRKENGYRVYTSDDIQKLKVVRCLKCANYSLSAILRMMSALEQNSTVNIKEVLNSPNKDDGIISVCDKLIISLHSARSNAFSIEKMLMQIKNKYPNPPL